MGLFFLANLSFAKTGNNEYPNRTITFVVPYTTGTTADVLARRIANEIAPKIGAPIIVDNKAGASGAIGTEAVAQASPDGYTFLFAATSHSTLPAVKKKLNYDPIKSFSPVILLGTSEMALVTSPSLKPNNFKDFLEYLKSHPDELDYSSPGTGGVQNLAMELFLQETSTKMLHVPYKGSSGALTDVTGGHVKATVSSLQTSSPFIKSGQLNMIAVMGEERSKAFPNVPTLKELGYPNLVVETWYGVLAPANTPKAILDLMNSQINLALLEKSLQNNMSTLGVNPSGGVPDKLGNLLIRESQKWVGLVKNRKLNID